MILFQKSRQADNLKRSDSSPARTRWVRLEGCDNSPYGSLFCFDPDAPGPGSVDADREYTVRVGRKVFRGSNPKTLLRLAVEARRKT